jgi:hypothetical protein
MIKPKRNHLTNQKTKKLSLGNSEIAEKVKLSRLFLKDRTTLLPLSLVLSLRKSLPSDRTRSDRTCSSLYRTSCLGCGVPHFSDRTRYSVVSCLLCVVCVLSSCVKSLSKVLDKIVSCLI